MNFRTEIHIKPNRFIDHSQKLMLLGSCFADNIGQKFVDFRFSADVNPFGVLYNPISIANGIECLLDKKIYSADDLFQHGGLWHSWQHHGSFSDPDADVALQKINARLQTAAENLANVDVLFVTFGSSRVFEYHGQVVANCHKVSNNQFVERRLTIDEIVSRYDALLAKLLQVRPQLKIVFSVSPYRYFGNDSAENARNKAVLVLAIEQICQHCLQAFYFPAYEIVLDELRDYRFYAVDMLHPSPLAVDYIWQRLSETYFTEQTRQLLPQIEAENKRLAHRNLHD